MSDRPVNRRSFFRQGLGELLRPLMAAIEPMEKVVRQIGEMESDRPPVPQSRLPVSGGPTGNWVRPPGALADADFLSTCARGGECVAICPAKCIQIDESGAKAGGVPFIEIDTMPCVLCEGLQCMHVCPSGALKPTPLGQIKMGTAIWREPTCLRRHGQDCRICIDDCPVGEVAIILKDGKVRVLTDGCTGCGVCQNHCPTNPKSIVIMPRESGVAVPRARR